MSKLKFQGKTIYTKTCVQNIVNCYLKGDVNNSTWYHDANTFCRILKSKSEHDYNKSISLESVCAVVSALSPQKSWEENKRIAENFILNDLFKGNTSSSINKAIRCLNSNDVYEHLNILNGEKTKAFYLNILYPKKITGATVDRHALEVALNKKLNNHFRELFLKLININFRLNL